MQEQQHYLMGYWTVHTLVTTTGWYSINHPEQEPKIFKVIHLVPTLDKRERFGSILTQTEYSLIISVYTEF